VSFGMGQVLDLVRGIGVGVASVRAGGGGARSAFWRQMLADVFGSPVAMTNTEEGPAYGAALLAGAGIGVWPTVGAACAACIGERDVAAPDAEASRAYAPSREVYARLYEELRESFGALGAVDAG